MWVVRHAKSGDSLRIRLHEIHHDHAHDLGVDPGLVKDGVEAHLQQLLAEHTPPSERAINWYAAST